MVVRHLGHATDFGSLTFAQQSQWIASAIDDLEAVIEQHVAQSSRRLETIAECLVQVDRLGRRLRENDALRNEQPGTGHLRPAIAGGRRLRVGSPRLADPARVVDFAMEMTEEPRDAGL